MHSVCEVDNRENDMIVSKEYVRRHTSFDPGFYVNRNKENFLPKKEFDVIKFY